MKKIVLTVLAVAGLTFTQAQLKVTFADQLKTTPKAKRSLEDFKLKLDFNRAEVFQENFLTSKNSGGVNPTAKNKMSPDATFYTQFWGQIKGDTQAKKLMYQMNYNYGADAKIIMKLMDENANVTKTVTAALPTTANNFGVLNDYFIDAEGKMNFLVYVHYFVGSGGPDNQKNGILVINESGEIRANLEGVTAQIVAGQNGNSLMTFNDNGDEVVITNYNLEDLTVKKTLALKSNLFTFLAGAPINFMDVKGVPSLVISHYEKLFMDNSTLEVYPDNHLVMGIYDLDLNLQKNILLDISSKYPDDPYTIPMGEFGLFYGYGKYDITDHTFNDDDSLEVLYGVFYYDMIQDKSWNHYYVSDESGKRIRSLEDQVVGSFDLKELPGQEDQISLFIGEGEEISALKMFNIKEWQTAFEFPAFYNQELLSLNFNRIPAGANYHYLFGMPTGDLEGDIAYGKINEYDKDGVFKKLTRLYLGENVINFTPLLYDLELDPHIINSDDDIEYSYASQHSTSGKSYNVFRIAKNENNILFEAEGDVAKGNLIGSNFVLNDNEQAKKLALIYTTGNYFSTVEFYNLPFATLATQNTVVKNQLQVYTDELTRTVKWNETASRYAIYNMAGSLVKQGVNAKSASTAGFTKGVYVLVITTPKGEKLTKRFLL